MKRTILFAFFAMTLFVSGLHLSRAYAQSDPFKINSYTTNDGMSQNYVNCIFQDSTGFLWIGTYKGLNRFDGYSFKRFHHDPAIPGSLASEQVETIIQDQKGDLWIGTANGLDKFSLATESFRNVSLLVNDSSFAHVHVKSLVITRAGNIWVGTYGSGLYLLNPRSNTIVRHEIHSSALSSIASDYINVIYSNNPDTLWIGTWLKGISCFLVKKGIFENYKSLTDRPDARGFTINSFTREPNGNLLIGTWYNGICELNKRTKTIRRFPPENSSLRFLSQTIVANILIDRDGYEWIATFNNGLVGYDPVSDKVVHYKTENPAPFNIRSNSIWRIYEDKFGVIWVASYGAGIIKIVKNKSNFQHLAFNRQKGLSDPNITSINSAGGDLVWMGSSNGLNRYNSHTGKIEHFYHSPGRNSIPQNSINAFCEDSMHNLWMGMYGEIGFYNARTGRFSTINPAVISNEHSDVKDIPYFSVATDKGGWVWFGTYDYGLYKYNPITKECRYYQYESDNSKSLSNNVIWTITCDSGDTVWIGTKSGLNRYDRRHDNFIRYYSNFKNNRSLSDDAISCIYEGKDKSLWITTLGGGLDHYCRKTNDFQRYTKNDGFPNNELAAITQDDRGIFWVSSNEIISSFDPHTGIIKTYDKNCGLTENSFNIGSAYRGADGNLYFGGNNGIDMFNPDSVHDIRQSANIVLTGFLRFDKPVEIGSKIKGRLILPRSINSLKVLNLNYTDIAVSIDFASLDFTSSMANRYAYMLKGFDKDWKYVDANHREASYNNLLPGHYVFMVKGTNHLGEWSKKVKQISINIAPPFWKTIPFKIFLVLAGCFAVYFYVWSRVRYYQRQRKILKRLVMRKITEVSRQNEMLESQNRELNAQKAEIIEMTEKIKLADNRKMNFFTNISHEFRTPLTLILGPSENLISDPKQPPSVLEQLTIIHKNARKLLRMINGILDFQRMDNQQLLVKMSESDIVKFSGEIVQAFASLAEQHHIDLRFIPDHFEFITWFDPEKLEIVLNNLVLNALKFTPKGGCVRVILHVDMKKNMLSFTVQDTGVGIQQGKLIHIFDRYYQIESSGGFQRGFGIGLAWTRELVDLMEGSIEAKSTLGKGSVFTFYLPILDRKNLKNSDRFVFVEESLTVSRSYSDTFTFDLDDPDFHPFPSATSHEKVLIVDDNADLRKYIHLCLHEQYQVIEAVNGKEGVEIARSKSPHLIISDLMMPEMDGMEFCRIIKSHISTSHIPLILLTARNASETQIDAYEMGADDYITKPFAKDLLLTRIKNLIQSREKIRKAYQSNPDIDPKEVTVTSADEKFLVTVTAVVEKHMDNPEFGVQELVNELSVSRSVLHVKLKMITGYSASEFIKTLRLKKAIRLLKNNKLRVSEVGYMVGFSDPHYFSKSFKKFYGRSPVQFVEEMNED